MCNVSVPLLAHFFQFASLSSFNHSELGRWRWRNQRGANSWTIYAQTSEWIREEPGVGSLPLIIWKPENERARREANTWVGLQRPTWEYLFIIMTIRSLPISNAYEQIILRYVTLHNPHSTSHSCKQKISCQSSYNHHKLQLASLSIWEINRIRPLYEQRNRTEKWTLKLISKSHLT
jgi:hypothetical protein